MNKFTVKKRQPEGAPSPELQFKAAKDLAIFRIKVSSYITLIFNDPETAKDFRIMTDKDKLVLAVAKRLSLEDLFVEQITEFQDTQERIWMKGEFHK